MIAGLVEGGIGDEEEEIGDEEVHGDARQHDADLLEMVDPPRVLSLGMAATGSLRALRPLRPWRHNRREESSEGSIPSRRESRQRPSPRPGTGASLPL